MYDRPRLPQLHCPKCDQPRAITSSGLVCVTNGCTMGVQLLNTAQKAEMRRKHSKYVSSSAADRW